MNFVELGKKIYNLNNPREAHRFVVFVARCCLHPQKMQRVEDFFSQSEILREVAEKFPFVYEQVTRAFFYYKSTFDERIKLVEEHMNFLAQSMKEIFLLKLYGYEEIFLWKMPVDENFGEMRFVISVHGGQKKEGLASIVLLLSDNTPVYQIMFWIAKDSAENDGSIIYRKLDWPEEWAITVCIPDVELATEISRSVIPKDVPIEDAVFNLKRMGMFVKALHDVDSELMKLALTDKLHQPYREKLIPGLKELNEAFKHEDDVLGCVLSGAGSSMLIISKYDVVDKVRSTTEDVMHNLNVKADIRTLKVEENGAEIISE